MESLENDTRSKNFTGKSAGFPHLQRGDLVRVKSARDILDTLDEKGMLGDLPFMPEMVEYIGGIFVVARTVEKTCLDYPHQAFRRFSESDVVFLDELRCSGSEHDGCQRGCMIFWKEAWLEKVEPGDTSPNPVYTAEVGALLERIEGILEGERFVCQSSQLERATVSITKWGRLFASYRDVILKNRNAFEAIYLLARSVFWKIRGKLLGVVPRGALKKTPTESLNLQPGDRVRVKTFEEILPTLSEKGKNRGMKFDLDMRFFCGKTYTVKRRLDKMIREDTGQMLDVKNTVILEGVNCQCIFAAGGCPRAEAFYWREIWLEKL